MRKIIALLTLASIFVTFNFAKAQDLENGKAKYNQICATCHGPSGDGDGPVAQALPPDQKPAKLSDSKRKFATDLAKFTELVKKGGAGVGLNPLMPPQPAFTDKDIKDIYAYTESFKK